VASVEYQADMKMSERRDDQLSEAYPQNSQHLRFALGILAIRSFARLVPTISSKKSTAGCWTARLNCEEVREWYANYEVPPRLSRIHDTASWTFSSFYFDVLKDRLYTKPQK